jgi:fructose-specific phosphotransferase system IIA component
MKILDFLAPEAIKIPLDAGNKRQALEEMVKILAKTGRVSDEKKVCDILLEREELGSTGIGQGIAIPHGKSDAVKELAAAFAISRDGLPFDALDGEPVHLLFMLVAPEGSAGIHLKALARISGLLKDKFFRKALLAAQTRDDVVRIIQDEEKAKH